MSNHKYKEWAAQKQKEREGLLLQARDLIAAGEFDAAEQLVRSKDGSLEADGQLALVYRECLRAAVATCVSRSLIVTMYHRAKAAAWRAYPDPHTEVEAEDYERGRERDVAELVKIVGRELETPTAPRVAPGGAL